MHYEKFAFAKDHSVPTIISRKGRQLGNKQGFTKVTNTLIMKMKIISL